MFEECEGCTIFAEQKPNPVKIDYATEFHLDENGELNFLFVGESFSSNGRTLLRHPTCRPLRDKVKELGIVYCGSTDMYKCKFGRWSQLGLMPGKHCRDVFIYELSFRPKLVVFVGSKSPLAVLHKYVSELPNEVDTFVLRGGEFNYIAVPHPANWRAHGDYSTKPCWDRRWLNIEEWWRSHEKEEK